MKKFILITLGILFFITDITQAQYSSVSNIRTPNNSTVQDCGVFTSTDFSYTSTQLAALTKEIYDNFNGAELVGAPTYKYNCHAYAWHLTEGGNNVWIGLNTNPTSIYWTDGSYVEVQKYKTMKPVCKNYIQEHEHDAIL